MLELTKMYEIVQGLKRLAATHVEAAHILHELVFAIGKNWGVDTGIGNVTLPPANNSPRQSFAPQVHRRPRNPRGSVERQGLLLGKDHRLQAFCATGSSAQSFSVSRSPAG